MRIFSVRYIYIYIWVELQENGSILFLNIFFWVSSFYTWLTFRGLELPEPFMGLRAKQGGNWGNPKNFRLGRLGNLREY